jgi:beta-glucosidase/6-phospho-beta-glucosidase/beta-galactosidase
VTEADPPTGVNVTGAFGWSIIDNFEWFSGSSVRFGMQYLNYETLERVPKASTFQFVNWFKQFGGARLPNKA